MEAALVPVIVAVIGLIQVAIGLFLGRQNQKASANLNEASALREIGDSYSTLVGSLENRLSHLEKDYREAGTKWEEERAELLAELERQQEACSEKFEQLMAENRSLRERLRELEQKEK
jgi:chromosome segregation ATPase